jgi:hypothetical protein
MAVVDLIQIPHRLLGGELRTGLDKTEYKYTIPANDDYTYRFRVTADLNALIVGASWELANEFRSQICVNILIGEHQAKLYLYRHELKCFPRQVRKAIMKNLATNWFVMNVWHRWQHFMWMHSEFFEFMKILSAIAALVTVIMVPIFTLVHWSETSSADALRDSHKAYQMSCVLGDEIVYRKYSYYHPTYNSSGWHIHVIGEEEQSTVFASCFTRATKLPKWYDTMEWR